MSRPWMKYYPRDWRADPRLRMCSLAARGLWADLLGYMHEAEPYGYLLIDGKSPTLTDIAALVGRPLPEVKKAFAELEQNGVHSVAENQTIYSRRMVRDGERSEFGRSEVASRWRSSDGLSRSQRLAEARKKGTHTKEEFQAMVEIFDGRCVRCGTEGDILRDHIVPLYQGGSDALENLQPLCSTCNRSKGPDNTDHRDRSLPEWRERLHERLGRTSETSQKTSTQKPEARGKNSEANASSVCVSSSATSFSELRETQVERSSGRRKQKTPLPQDFETVADRGIARKLGWPEIRIDQQIQAFCDSARAHSRVYADWQAAWKNWCRSPYQQQNGKTNGLHGKHAGSILDAIDDLPDFEGGSDQTTGENPLLGLPPR